MKIKLCHEASSYASLNTMLPTSDNLPQVQNRGAQIKIPQGIHKC